jgi:peptidyl-Asp metalloendopeptidase
MRASSILALFWVLAAAPIAAQQAPAPTSQPKSMIVTLEGRHDQGRLDRLKAELGVTESTPIFNLDAEIWQVPEDKLLTAFRSTRRRDVATVDYTGSDWRTLFLPVSGADLAPVQSRAIQTLSADPKLTNVQLVRLRAGDITERLLTKGLGSADGLPKEKSLILNVAPGLNLLAARNSLEGSADRTLQWTGSATSLPAAGLPTNLATGEVSLVVTGDQVLGSVDVGVDTYSIIPLSGGLHAIAKVQKSEFPPEHPPLEELPAATTSGPTPATGDAPLAATADRATQQPLMIGVAYTKEALEALAAAQPGATAETYAKLAILKTNNGFKESGITGRVDLAGTTVLSEAETGDFNSMTNAVVAPEDGKFDSIHTWRRRTKSDAVMVMVKLSAFCGNAAGVHVAAPSAFAIVNWDCAVTNLSFPHEFGHLLGARHDPDTDPIDTPFAYAHGYRFRNAWRTIMAYAGGECISCARINRWANPDQSMEGVPLGTTQRNHDARLMQEMLPLYAQFMP